MGGRRGGRGKEHYTAILINRLEDADNESELFYLLEEIYRRKEIPGNKYGIGAIKKRRSRSQWALKAKRLVIRRLIN